MSAVDHNWRQSWMRLQGHLMRGRAILGLTQTEAADRLGVSRSTFQRWETGRAVPDAFELFRWADMLGVAITSSAAAESVKSDALPRVGVPASLAALLANAHAAAPSSNDGEYAAAGRTFHGNSAGLAFPVSAEGAAR